MQQLWIVNYLLLCRARFAVVRMFVSDLAGLSWCSLFTLQWETPEVAPQKWWPWDVSWDENSVCSALLDCLSPNLSVNLCLSWYHTQLLSTNCLVIALLFLTMPLGMNAPQSDIITFGCL